MDSKNIRFQKWSLGCFEITSTKFNEMMAQKVCQEDNGSKQILDFLSLNSWRLYGIFSDQNTEFVITCMKTVYFSKNGLNSASFSCMRSAWFVAFIVSLTWFVRHFSHFPPKAVGLDSKWTLFSAPPVIALVRLRARASDRTIII